MLQSIYIKRDPFTCKIDFQAVEKTKYDQIFDGLQPVNGLLSGDKVKPVSGQVIICIHM